MSERERERAAVAFAAAMGWTYVPPNPGDRYSYFETGPEDEGECIELPWADDTLPEHLGFVGRVAAALGARAMHFIMEPRVTCIEFHATRDDLNRAIEIDSPGLTESAASDPSWAALLAATAAKGAR